MKTQLEQTQLFDTFGMAPKTCQSCQKAVPQNCPKTGIYLFCNSCREQYARSQFVKL